MQENHLVALERRHAELDRRIAEEMGRPVHDQLAISALKRQKLVLKDRMTSARSERSH